MIVNAANAGFVPPKSSNWRGTVDHRNVFFSDEEKHENRHMCSCVSPLTTGGAVIDIGFR